MVALQEGTEKVRGCGGHTARGQIMQEGSNCIRCFKRVSGFNPGLLFYMRT